jgi:CubicO group peptidase (beta-lactamase class C family)
LICRTETVLAEYCESGAHTGALLSMSLSGRLVQWSSGEMRPGVPMTPDVVIPWLSAGKLLTATAVAQLWEQGKLGLDDTVVRWVPAFADRGKESITLRHVLTHTGGFRSMFDLDGRADSSQDAVQRICASRLERDWVPGRRAAYQARSGWQILGEVVRQVSGVAPEEYVTEHVLRPAGMAQTWLWASADVADTLGDRLAPLFDTTGSEPIPAGETGASYCSPGAGACGTVDDLRRFYEMLLAGGMGPDGDRVLQPATVAAMVERQREGLMDESFRHVIDWGLGFVLDSNQHGADTVPYGYGRHCSHRTFGHGGSQCCTGFADPEHGLAVAMIVNGRPGEAAHGERFRRALSALYEDLGLR